MVITMIFMIDYYDYTDMIIRVDKCHSFRIKKSGTSSKQFQPKLFVNNEIIPPVKQDEYFT